MSYPISACVFIRNNNQGGFCLWESIASLMNYVSEFVVLDLGSNDGTLDTLWDISAANPKFNILQGNWPKQDASAFAILANQLIERCQYDNVLFYQADEIWHPRLLQMMKEYFDKGRFDLAFWRIQFKYNFQQVKWYPHPVHRIGPKNDFNFVNDGMNTDRSFGVDVCSDYNQGWFTKWGDLGPENIKPYVNQMITDVSQTGGFLNTIVEKRRLHTPFWGNEGMAIEGQPVDEWYEKQKIKKNYRMWTKTDSPYDIPKVLKYHLGKLRYEQRNDLIEAIKNDNTEQFIFD